jgi:selenocysteine lyase/cysteine desulfurase
MYAPYGIGVLIGNFDELTKDVPYMTGGGTVKIVTLENVVWEDPPEMDEAGTPVIIGVVALMEAINVLESVGWDAIIKHEAALTAYALKRLKEIPDIRMYCKTDESLTDQQLGVIPFNLGDLHHALVSAVLSYEGGIGVRNGCFCAHPFILYLMKVPVEKALEVREMIIGGDRSAIPGLIRMSFGCYNNESEVDELIDILKMVKDGKYIGEYEMDPVSGNCFPKGYSFNFDKYFKL